MIELLIDILIYVFMFIGLAFLTLGILGLYTLPDIFSKQHSLGLLDTGGIFFIALSLSLMTGLELVSLKPIFLALLVALVSAPLCYAFMQVLLVREEIIKKKTKEKEVSK